MSENKGTLILRVERLKRQVFREQQATKKAKAELKRMADVVEKTKALISEISFFSLNQKATKLLLETKEALQALNSDT